MLRVFLSRRWLGWHALLLVGLAVLVLLGRWQWDRAQSQVGTLQNLSYAFEWWLFACLAVYGWWREMRADARVARASEVEESNLDPAAADNAAPVTVGLGRTAMSAHPVEEADDEVAAYNAYLARLNARYSKQPH